MSESAVLPAIVCPETRQPLAEADSELILRLNTRIAEGDVNNRAGDTVTEPVTGALVREDGQVLYPVVDRIAKLIADEAIPLQQVSH